MSAFPVFGIVFWNGFQHHKTFKEKSYLLTKSITMSVKYIPWKWTQYDYQLQLGTIE